MDVHIRLLGTVELWIDGQQMTPGAAKRRTVLAGLALDANRRVSLARLAGMVWSDPPASAVANLRSHAAALRHALGERLLARPGGYELRLTGQELDVSEFQRLVEDGRARMRASDPAGAVDALTAALAQRRGRSGDGLPRGTSLDNGWASLDEQRRQVFEDLVDAQLAVGGHGELLPELRRLLSAHPLRERAWGQLMLALYRRGDVPAALTAYRDARAALHEQLGIEPGEELQRLHRAMLDRSPELSLDPPANGRQLRGTAGSAPVQGGVDAVPRELPPRLATFVGRTLEYAEAVAAVGPGTSAAALISGAAGSGKTALAVRVAHGVATHFPDGQVYLDLGYEPSFSGDDVLARVLRALGVDGATIAERACERAGRVRSLLAARRVLVVVDGVTHAAQVRALVPAGPGSALIVVAQRHLRSLDGVRRVALTPLPGEDGRALLDALGCADQLASAPADAAELVRLCAGSPLALRIAASRLYARAEAGVARLVGELRDARRRLDWLADDDLSVRQRIALGYTAVRTDDDVVGSLFTLLGAHPEEAAPVDAAARLGVPAERLWHALEKLLDAHLVCLDASGAYRLPPLVRDYAAELAELSAMPALHPLPAWRDEPTAGPVPVSIRPVRHLT